MMQGRGMSGASSGTENAAFIVGLGGVRVASGVMAAEGPRQMKLGQYLLTV